MSPAVRNLIQGQAVFFFFLLACMLVSGQGFGHNRGFSFFGANGRTVVLYALGFALAAVFFGRAALELDAPGRIAEPPARDRAADRHRPATGRPLHAGHREPVLLRHAHRREHVAVRLPDVLRRLGRVEGHTLGARLDAGRQSVRRRRHRRAFAAPPDRGARRVDPRLPARVRPAARTRRPRRSTRRPSRPRSSASTSPRGRGRPRPEPGRDRARRAGRTGGRRGRRPPRGRARRFRRARRPPARPPPRRPCARTPRCPRSRSSAVYEPSGRSSARCAIVRQSAGAKHESEPVWHAGPAGRTRTRSASPSQSSRSSSTASVFPDVAPFRQSSCRDRLQNHASPVSRVSRSASASIHASIRTRPLSASCTIAARRAQAASRSVTPSARSSSRSETSRPGSSCRIDASSAACATSSARRRAARCRRRPTRSPAPRPPPRRPP